MSIGNAIIASRLKVGYMDDYFFIEIGKVYIKSHFTFRPV